MRRFIYILLIFSFSLVMSTGCENKSLFDKENGYWGEQEEIFIPGGNGAIYFDVGAKTKGTLLYEFPKESFNVLGYRYNGAWDVVKEGESSQVSTVTFTNGGGKGNIVTEPKGVFYDNETEVTSETNLTGVQKVTWDGTSYNYTPLKQWEPNLTYSFFAWYPADNEKIVASGSDVDGDPYITYTLTLPTSDTSAEAARKAMVDLMVACEIDYTKSKGISVPFMMNHRLSGLDMRATSLVDAKALRELYGTATTDPETGVTTAAKYPEWSEIEDNATVTLTITSFTLTFDEIASSVKIPLNTKSSSFDYSVQATTTDVKFFNAHSVNKDIDGTVQSFIAEEDRLILIPQTEAIKATGTLTYTISCNGISPSFTETAETTIPNLSPGGYYSLLFTISKSGLVVKVQQASRWGGLVEIDHDFD